MVLQLKKQNNKLDWNGEILRLHVKINISQNHIRIQ